MLNRLNHPHVIKNLTLAGCLLAATEVNAQEYNFNFYNGDVTHSPKQTVQKVAPEQRATPVTKPEPIVKTPTETVADPQKTVRTGLAFLGGYSHESFRNGDEDINKVTGNTTRLGVSFISEYDYNLDVELLFTNLKANTDFGEYTGRTTGLSIGSRHNYWMNDQFAITMGGSLRGYNGEFSEKTTLSSFGARLGAGPAVQIGKNAQLLLTYEFGLDRIKLKDDNLGKVYDSSWNQNSSLKAMLAYRF